MPRPGYCFSKAGRPLFFARILSIIAVFMIRPFPGVGNCQTWRCDTMKINRVLILFAAIMIGFPGAASTAEACAADEWCCKRDFKAPGNPCIKCCPKNQPGSNDALNKAESTTGAETKIQSCKQPRQASAEPVLLSKAEGPGFDKSAGGEAIRHGSWHPCAEDPDACGSGHVCCAGHCIYGSTCGGN